VRALFPHQAVVIRREPDEQPPVSSTR
jgi:hypothetical protein